MRERRGWIEGSAAQLRLGCVRFYRTHEEHTDWRGRTFPVGSQCFAGRLPSGGVFLLFLTLGNPPGDPASVVFLPRNYGLCGIEPHVLDPRKTNHLMADLAARKACRDAFDLFARWEEQAAEERKEQEDSILQELARKTGEEIERSIGELKDREPEVRLERMHSQIEKQVDGIGRDLEAHAERIQAATITEHSDIPEHAPYEATLARPGHPTRKAYGSTKEQAAAGVGMVIGARPNPTRAEKMMGVIEREIDRLERELREDDREV